MEKVIVRQPHNYNADKVSNDTGLKCEDESLTVQADAQDADINVLVKRFHLTGQMPQWDKVPLMEDFTGIGTYQQALDRLRAADELFMELPAETRRKFDHNPQEFLEFTSNPANREEMEKMGLLRPTEAPEAPFLVKVQATPPTTPENTPKA